MHFNKCNYIIDTENKRILQESYHKYGLRSEGGRFKQPVLFNYNGITRYYIGLSCMNDSGITWSEIAKYVRENPENVFEKSV